MRASEIIKKYKLQLNKRLDQHFLVDKNIIKKEVELAEVSKQDVVLEIGAGIGLLTEELLRKAKKVVAVEKDARLVEVLKNEFRDSMRNGALEIIQGDALKVEYPHFDKCVSNIPYSIASRIIERLAKYKKDATLCVQKEFAERLVAKPGAKDYSRISILVQFYFNPRYLWTVSKNSFFPKPKVDSAIIRLIPRKETPGIEDEELFFKVVNLLFAHKRKTVRNALISERKRMAMDKKEAMAVFQNVPHSNKKVFQLSIPELIQIYEWLSVQEVQPFKG